MSYSSVASTYYDTSVTLYRWTTLDSNNEPVYVSSTIRCRLDRKTVRVQGVDGNAVVCSHVMLTDSEINPVRDYIVTAAMEKLVPAGVFEHKDFSISHYEVFLK